MKSVTDRVLKGTVWLSVARAIVNALSVLSTIVLARLLAPADFGLVALVTTMMLVVTEVTELSLSQALVRHAAPTREHFDTAWTLNALRGTVLGVAFAGMGVPVAAFYEDPRLVAIMAAMGASIVLSGLINPRRVLLTRQLIFWQEFVLSVGQKLAGVAVSLVVAYVYRSYWALMAGILVTQLANVAISYMVLPFRPRIRLAHGRELLSFSLWVTAVQVVNTLNWRFDAMLIGKVLGNTALGHYSVGSTLASIPTRETTGPLRATLFPAFSSIQGDRTRLASAYQRAQAVVTAIALPAGIGAALVADPLIRLTMGDKWEPAIYIVQALAAVYALQTLGSSVDPLGMARGETRLLFVRSVQMLLVRVPVIAAAMVFFGMVGVVTARVATGLLAAGVNMLLVRRLIGVDVLDQLRVNGRALASALVMVIGATLVAHVFPRDGGAYLLAAEVACVAAAALTLYCGTTLALWSFQGRPAGPEEAVRRLFARAWARLKRRGA